MPTEGDRTTLEHSSPLDPFLPDHLPVEGKDLFDGPEACNPLQGKYSTNYPTHLSFEGRRTCKHVGRARGTKSRSNAVTGEKRVLVGGESRDEEEQRRRNILAGKPKRAILPGSGVCNRQRVVPGQTYVWRGGSQHDGCVSVGC